MEEQWPFKPLVEGSSPSALILLFNKVFIWFRAFTQLSSLFCISSDRSGFQIGGDFH